MVDLKVVMVIIVLSLKRVRAHAYKDMSLPQDKTTGTVMTLRNTCSCKYYCLHVGCSCFQSTRTGNERETSCVFTTDNVPVYSMTTQIGTTVVCSYASEYTPFGSLYYKIYTDKKKRTKAAEKCVQDGGQLAVLDNERRLSEFRHAIAKFDTSSSFWIGLKMPNTATKKMFWTFGNDSNIEIGEDVQKIQLGSRRCFKYTSSATHAENIINNLSLCSATLEFVCQREF